MAKRHGNTNRHELLLFVSCLQTDTWFCTVRFRLCWITGRVFFWKNIFFTDFSMFRARQEKCCCSWILSRRHTSLRLISQGKVPSDLQGLGCYFSWRSTLTNRSLVLQLLPNPFGFLCTIAQNLCLLNIILHLKVFNLTLWLWVFNKYNWCTDKIN